MLSFSKGRQSTLDSEKGTEYRYYVTIEAGGGGGREAWRLLSAAGVREMTYIIRGSRGLGKGGGMGTAGSGNC